MRLKYRLRTALGVLAAVGVLFAWLSYQVRGRIVSERDVRLWIVMTKADVPNATNLSQLERDVISALDISLPEHGLTVDDLHFAKNNRGGSFSAKIPGETGGYSFNRRGRWFFSLRERRWVFDPDDVATLRFNEAVERTIRAVLESTRKGT